MRDSGSLEHGELLTRSTNVRADTELVKSHQWQATALSLTLSGGMFALLRSHPIHMVSLSVAVISILQAVMTVWFQISFVISLSQYRADAELINERLNKITYLYEKLHCRPRSGQKALSILLAIAFALIALAGAALTFYYSGPMLIRFIVKLIRCIYGRGT
jgi:hypothetical protein